ncbi:MAG: hypothetical protein J0M16_00470 [Gammaproteobacteria bacterium]|nr:hypothetical protein [Gammaproteobacteria bacterium]
MALLERLAAAHGAGRLPPPDLAEACLRWLARAAAPILAGTDPAAALGLETRQGQRSIATRCRQAKLDAGLAAAYQIAEGSQERRGDKVLHWWDLYQEGRPVPEGVAAAFRLVVESGQKVPTNAVSVARAVTRDARTRVVTGNLRSGKVGIEGSPIAAREVKR